MAISRWCGRCLTTHSGKCPRAVERENRWRDLKQRWSGQRALARIPTPVANARRRRLKEDGWRCDKCGAAKGLEVDHIKAIRDGGDDVEGNLQVLCRQCHKEKSKAEALAGRHERMRQASGIMQFAVKR